MLSTGTSRLSLIRSRILSPPEDHEEVIAKAVERNEGLEEPIEGSEQADPSVRVGEPLAEVVGRQDDGETPDVLSNEISRERTLEFAWRVREDRETEPREADGDGGAKAGERSHRIQAKRVNRHLEEANAIPNP